MNPIEPQPKAFAGTVHRRTIRYVDTSIQRWLLVAMVVLEIALVLAVTWAAHWQLDNLIDEALYRVHITETAPLWRQFAQSGFTLLTVFAGVNILALLIAEGIWSHRENIVVRDFTRLAGKSRKLDFSADAAPEQHHEVLTLAVAWRARERERFAAIRQEVAKLNAASQQGNPVPELQVGINRLKALLA